MTALLRRNVRVWAAALFVVTVGEPGETSAGEVLTVEAFQALPPLAEGRRVQVRGLVMDVDGASADFFDHRGIEAKTYLDMETMEPGLARTLAEECGGIVVEPDCVFVVEGAVVHFPAADGGGAYNDLSKVSLISRE